MIIQNDKRRLVSQILGDGPEKKEESSQHTCMSEFIECVHDHDVEGALSALKACLVDIGSEEPPQEEG